MPIHSPAAQPLLPPAARAVFRHAAAWLDDAARAARARAGALHEYVRDTSEPAAQEALDVADGEARALGQHASTLLVLADGDGPVTRGAVVRTGDLIDRALDAAAREAEARARRARVAARSPQHAGAAGDAAGDAAGWRRHGDLAAALAAALRHVRCAFQAVQERPDPGTDGPPDASVGEPGRATGSDAPRRNGGGDGRAHTSDNTSDRRSDRTDGTLATALDRYVRLRLAALGPAHVAEVRRAIANTDEGRAACARAADVLAGWVASVPGPDARRPAPAEGRRANAPPGDPRWPARAPAAALARAVRVSRADWAGVWLEADGGPAEMAARNERLGEAAEVLELIGDLAETPAGGGAGATPGRGVPGGAPRPGTLAARPRAALPGVAR